MKLSNLLFQRDARVASSPGHARVVPVHASIDSSFWPSRPPIRGVRKAPQQHHWFTRILHWTTFLFLVVAAAAILARAYASDRATLRLLLQIHQSSGLTVLALTLSRLVWRTYARVGALHATLALRQRIAAAIGHHALYATTLALTVLGWLTSNAFGLRLRYFDLLPMPIWIARDRDLGDTLQDWHADAAWVLLALVVGHLAAALWHHHVRRDDVLRSMQLLRNAPVSCGVKDRKT